MITFGKGEYSVGKDYYWLRVKGVRPTFYYVPSEDTFWVKEEGIRINPNIYILLRDFLKGQGIINYTNEI